MIHTITLSTSYNRQKMGIESCEGKFSDGKRFYLVFNENIDFFHFDQITFQTLSESDNYTFSLSNMVKIKNRPFYIKSREYDENSFCGCEIVLPPNYFPYYLHNRQAPKQIIDLCQETLSNRYPTRFTQLFYLLK